MQRLNERVHVFPDLHKQTFAFQALDRSHHRISRFELLDFHHRLLEHRLLHAADEHAVHVVVLEDPARLFGSQGKFRSHVFHFLIFTQISHRNETETGRFFGGKSQQNAVASGSHDLAVLH